MWTQRVDLLMCGAIFAAEQFALVATDFRKFLRSDLVEKLTVEGTSKAIGARTDLGASGLFGLELCSH